MSRQGITSLKYPKMVTATALESRDLLDELRETFLSSGCSEGEFESLLERRHLPDWCLQWMNFEDQQHGRRLQDLFDQYLPPYSLVEIQVRNDADEETGKALISMVERKTGNGHFSATVSMLASTDPQFLDWGNLHFTDLKDYDVHFCKKAAGRCTSKPRSKTLGWYHVSRFRLVTVKMACEVNWMIDAALSNFSDQLQDYMSSGRGAGGPQRSGSPRIEDSPARGADGQAEVRGRSEEEEKKERVADKKRTIKVPFRGSVGRMGKPEMEPGQRGPAEEVARQSKVKEDAAKLARESALAANRALSGRGPQLVDVPRVDLRAREEKPRTDLGLGAGYGRSHGRSFLDDIATVVSDDPMEVPREGARRQVKERGRRPGGGGGHSDDDDDDKRGDRGRDKKRKRSRSSSPGKEPRPRGTAVIAPSKRKEKKRRGSGDPGSDPSSSSDSRKGGKKDDKKKRASRSPQKRRRGDKHKKDSKRKKKAPTRKGGKKSSSGSRSSNSQDELYGHETSKYESLVEKAKRNPGRLLRSGLEQMAKFLAARAGSEGELEGSWRQQKVTAYLNQVLFNQHPPSTIGMRNARELVTLAEALDLLMEENFAGLGDLLMQRMKAVEASLSEGWGVANYQELIPPPKATLTTDQERAFATRHAIQQKRLQEAVVKKKTG